MDPATGALIGAGISSAAGLFGGSKANKSAKKIAREQMAFQKETLQNQHQWQVNDLRAAGLNPRLSANLGGAGSAAGASAPVLDESKSVIEGVNSAVAAIRAKEEITNMRETNNVLKTQSQLNLANASSSSAAAHKTNVDAAIKSKLIPGAQAIGTVTGKALSTAKGLAAENRSLGFKKPFMSGRDFSLDRFKAIGGWLSNKAGF